MMVTAKVGRELAPREDGVELRQVAEALATAWCKETSNDGRYWTPTNPSWGQCAATAVMVRRLFGGHIMRTTVEITKGIKWPSDRPRKYRHYYNEVPGGEGVDLTATQFPLDSRFHVSSEGDEPRARSLPFGERVVQRAILLEKRVYKALGVEWGKPKNYQEPGEADPGLVPVEAAPGLVVAKSTPIR